MYLSVQTPEASPPVRDGILPRQQEQDMSPRSGRKKPICQRCGQLMAGHKRPYGAPICPRDETAPASSPTPSLTLEPTLPVVSAAAPSKTARRGLTPDFVFNPSASGYWHRKNPNWVDPDTFPTPATSQPRRRPMTQTRIQDYIRDDDDT